MNKCKRLDSIDIAKGLGMIFVVMFHAELFSGIWTQFHMPLFAFLSGIVYRERYNSSCRMLVEYIKKKIRTIYIPFVLYNFVFLIFHNMFYKIHIYGPLSNGRFYEPKDFVEQILAILTLGGGESLPGPLWYLIAMIEFTIGYAFIRYIISRILKDNSSDFQNIVVSIISLLLLGVGFLPISLPRLANKAFILIFYYNIGYLIYYYRGYITAINSQHKFSISFLCSLIILVFGKVWGGGMVKILLFFRPGFNFWNRVDNVLCLSYQ